MIECDLSNNFGEWRVLVVQGHFIAEAFFDFQFAFGAFTAVNASESFATFRQFTPAAGVGHVVVPSWSDHGFFNIIQALQEAVGLAFLHIFIEGDLLLQFGLFDHDCRLRQVRIEVLGLAGDEFRFSVAAFLHLQIEIFHKIREFLFDADFCFRFKLDGFHDVAIFVFASEVWSLLIAPCADGGVAASNVAGQSFQGFLAERSRFDGGQRVVQNLQSFIRIGGLHLFSAEHAVHDFSSQAIILNV